MRILLMAAAPLLVAALPAQAQEWWDSYNVGDEVMFSVSEQAADFQPCVVSEAHPSYGIRVRCNAFKHWPAKVFIVYSQKNIRAAGEPAPAAAPARRTAAAPAPRPAAAGGGTLKAGEYACYGSGGRILAGLGFKMSGGRYTDLEGGNAGSVAIGGGMIRFTGGHLGGQTGRITAANHFVLGQQTSCELF